MASNVNVFYSNWQKTGQKVQVDKYTTDLTIQWTDDEGLDRGWSGTITFPNDLADVPNPWLKEMLLELTLRAVRVKLGIDSGEDY